MIPKTLSASSVLVSEACMERWRVENFERAPSASNGAAMVGTACHYVLEHFVEKVYLDKTAQWSDWDLFLELYQTGYMKTFSSGDFSTPEYADGLDLVTKWYQRHASSGGLEGEVLSVEQKKTFPIKTSAGEIPFTYILDRLDKIADGVYEVVDYKSIRAFTRPEDVKNKIQTRAYALAIQIEYPDAERIIVSLDMLRQGEKVGAVFTREDNVQTYRYLQRAAERIIATPEDETKETLNEECKWCIKKTTCETLAASVKAGSVNSLSLEQVAERKLLIDAQMLALKYAQDELDKVLLQEAARRDELEFEVGNLEVKVTARRTRKPNSSAIARIVGPEIAAKYGNFSVTNVDKMLKSGELTPAQYAAVTKEITTSFGEPSAKVKSKGPI